MTPVTAVRDPRDDSDMQYDVNSSDARERAVWRVLEGVMDPEIPVLSVVEIGIVRHAHWTPDG